MDISKTNYKPINETLDINVKDVIHCDLNTLGKIQYISESPLKHCFKYTPNGYGNEIVHSEDTMAKSLYKLLYGIKQCPNMYANDPCIYNKLGSGILDNFRKMIDVNISKSLYTNSPLLYTLNENAISLDLVLLPDGLTSTYGSLRIIVKPSNDNKGTLDIRICSGNSYIDIRLIARPQNNLAIIEEEIINKVKGYIDKLYIQYRNDDDTLYKKLNGLPNPENIRVYFTYNSCNKTNYNFINPVSQEALKTDKSKIKSALIFKRFEIAEYFYNWYESDPSKTIVFDAIIADDLPFLI